MGICRSDVCSKFCKDGCPKSAHLTKRATIQKRSKEINVCTHLDPKWDTRNLSNSIKFNPHHPPKQVDCYCEHCMFSSRMSWSHKCKSPWYPALTWAQVKSHKEQIFVGRKSKLQLHLQCDRVTVLVLFTSKTMCCLPYR